MDNFSDLIHSIDQVRLQDGFLTISQTAELNSKGNIIYDPFSTLISKFARIGKKNVFYPGSIFRCSEISDMTIGSGNIFYSQTLLESSGGSIVIGDNNQFGTGGFTAMADREKSSITIGNQGRYTSGVSVFGVIKLGNGSQIHGAITISNSEVSGGGDFTCSNPDERGGVLKGFGSGKGLHVAVGEVIVGAGSFEQKNIQRQTFYHPNQEVSK